MSDHQRVVLGSNDGPCAACESRGHSLEGHGKVTAAYRVNEPVELQGELPIDVNIIRVRIEGSLYRTPVLKFEGPAVLRSYRVAGHDIQTLQWHPKGITQGRDPTSDPPDGDPQK